MAKRTFLADIDLAQNQLLFPKIHSLGTAPSGPVEGQMYFNTTSKILFVYNNTDWIDALQQDSTASATALSVGTNNTTTLAITSDGGVDDVSLPAASSSLAGILTSAKFDEIVANTAKTSDINHNVSTNLSEGTASNTSVVVNSSDGTNATLLAASTSRAGLLTKVGFDAITANTAKTSDINHNVTTNLSTTSSTTNNVVVSSDGTNATLTAASTSKAGLMTKAIFDEHVVNNAKTSNVAETVTSLELAANILTYTDEDGTETDLNLALYLDDSNLARLTSGSLNSATGIATFTRDDASTFTIDMSAFLDAITLNNTLTSTSTTQGLTANQGKVLKDLIDALVTSTGSNTGDEPAASTTVAGITEYATISETNTGTSITRSVTPDGLDGWTGSAQINKVGNITTGTWNGDVITNSNLASVNGVVTNGTHSGTNTGDQSLSGLGGVASNTSITAGTKTKITYDAKGLVTAGTNATTADIAESNDKNYVSNDESTAVGNLSGTNSGDEPLASSTVKGIVELATNAETSTGTDTSRAVTPASLSSLGYASGTVKKTQVDCAASTTTTVTHALGQYVNVNVYRKLTPFDQVEAQVTSTNSTTVVVTFNVAPTAAEYVIVVQG